MNKSIFSFKNLLLFGIALLTLFVPRVCSNGDFNLSFEELIQSSQRMEFDPRISLRSDNEVLTENGDLALQCFFDYRPNRKIRWTLPNGNVAKTENRTVITVSIEYDIENNVQVATSQLVVRKLNKTKDTGSYRCDVDDRAAFYNVGEIFGVDDSFINITYDPKEKDIDIRWNDDESARTKWFVEFSAYPKPTLVWLDNNGVVIPWSTVIDGNQRLNAVIDDRSTTLEIFQPSIADSGNYTLHVYNGRLIKTENFHLLVKEKPQLSMNASIAYVMQGESIGLLCWAYGYPSSTITWSFTPDSGLGFDKASHENSYYSSIEKSKLVDATPKSHSEFNQSSVWTFTPESSGYVTCAANNSEGSGEIRTSIRITDLEKELFIWSAHEIISLRENASVWCGASVYKYTSDLNWLKDGVLVEDSDDVKVITANTAYSYRKQMLWSSVSNLSAGNYDCQAINRKDGSADRKNLQMIVVSPKAPVIDCTNMYMETTKHSIGDSVVFRCRFNGVPQPTVEWYKNDVLLHANDMRIKFSENNTLATITNITNADNGTYQCTGRNLWGTLTTQTTLEVMNATTTMVAGPIANNTPIIVSAISLVFVICTLYLCWRIRSEKNLVRELKAAGLANFEEGNPECINPELTMDEQAELLPYDRKFEFPRARLKLGKQLGTGEFGIVMKAYAQGILPYEDETAVAVKMVKRMADNEVVRALVSELKILVHLGQHLNTVNLLGAVTKNIAKRELMVIVEYCRFGNLQSFLVTNRQHFVDQIDRNDDRIDFTILKRQQYENIKTGPNVQSTPGDCPNVLASLPRTVTTADLLCWSFQVARGMQYLSSRKVLHGDLAARNILLCEDNVVKICDFGLARSMYKNDTYVKNAGERLPFKWLAIESISDMTFSTYSDVWSFGVVLWELFSLGAMPYGGMDADEALFMKLKNGYRMEKPQNATQKVYDIMLSCWRLVPESRPNFDKLEEMIGKLLPNGVDRHYICLNEPYVQANVLNKCRSQTDYFALMTSPSYHAPSVPESPSVLETAESQPTSKSFRETFSAHDKIGARLRSCKQSENEAEEMPMMKRSDQYVPVDFGNSNNCQYVNVLTNPKSNQCNVVASTEHKEVDGNRCASNPCYLMVSQDDAMKI